MQLTQESINEGWEETHYPTHIVIHNTVLSVAFVIDIDVEEAVGAERLGAIVQEILAGLSTTSGE